MMPNAIDVRVQSQLQEQIGIGPPEILYIMGTGRSGTTILEILLANNEDFAGVGEAKHIFRDGYLGEHTCACGSAAASCELWSAVLKEAGWRRDEFHELARVVERSESHARFPLTWLGWPKGAELERYRRAILTMYAAVANASRKTVIVDSSKYPARALLLARLVPNRVKVLCITRSPGGLLEAFAKKNKDEQRPKGTLSVTVYYLYVLLCMRLVKARLGERCKSVRFEDLTDRPANVLSEVESWSGHSLSIARQKLASGDCFDVGHIVTGNRLRKKGRVRFEPPTGRSNCETSRLRTWVARALSLYRRALGF